MNLDAQLELGSHVDVVISFQVNARLPAPSSISANDVEGDSEPSNDMVCNRFLTAGNEVILYV